MKEDIIDDVWVQGACREAHHKGGERGERPGGGQQRQREDGGGARSGECGEEVAERVTKG